MATRPQGYTTAPDSVEATTQTEESVLHQAYRLLDGEDPADPEAQTILDDIRDFGTSYVRERKAGNTAAASDYRARIGRRLVQYRALEQWDRKPSKGSWLEQALPTAVRAGEELEHRLPDTWREEDAPQYAEM